MRMITVKKPAFTELFNTGVLTRIVAVKSPDGGGWRLFGLWRDKDIAVLSRLLVVESGVVRSGLRLTSAGAVELASGRFTAKVEPKLLQ